MPLKLNSPDEHQLPMWYANTEILFRDAGVANERVMFNLFRGALTSSQADTWAKFLYDAALTSSPYTQVKNALINATPIVHTNAFSKFTTCVCRMMNPVLLLWTASYTLQVMTAKLTGTNVANFTMRS